MIDKNAFKPKHLAELSTTWMSPPQAIESSTLDPARVMKARPLWLPATQSPVAKMKDDRTGHPRESMISRERRSVSLNDDIRFMQQALKVATEKGSDPALSPIGCVIVMDGQILASQRNHVADYHDAVAHAEIEAIRAAGKKFENGELRGATLYTTLQPCGMCTMASIWSKVRRIVYGAGREDVHEMYFEARHVDTLKFVQKAYRDDLTIEGGILRDECSRLYYRPWDVVPEQDQGNK